MKNLEKGTVTFPAGQHADVYVDKDGKLNAMFVHDGVFYRFMLLKSWTKDARPVWPRPNYVVLEEESTDV